MLALLILISGVLARLIWHAPNFTPVIALAFFGGAYLSRRQALWVPLALMAVSDLLIGLHDTVAFTWGSIFLVSCLGFVFKGQRPVMTVTGSLLGAGLFFVITNFGAWLSLYPRTADGLMQCYIAALPFFRNTLWSTLISSVLLVGGYAGAVSRLRCTRFAGLVTST